MSVITVYTLTCDNCEEECEYNGYTPSEARRVAKDVGWVRRR